MRNLTELEKRRLKILTENSVSTALIEPTATGLEKSILDATGSVRNYLKENNFHDYEQQGQGSEHKIVVESDILSFDSVKKSRTSLYRPETKKGDPRIWFSGLPEFSNPNDILALIYFDEKINVLNLTQMPIEDLIDSPKPNPIQELIQAVNSDANAVADELLEKLRRISKSGFIPSMVDADTSVGRTLETALDIPINSSQKPDYKGIELKSFRGKRGNRKNLFAQVPDWKLSKFKSSAEILDNFGYWRDEDFKLYCTISSINRNSQGLTLRVDTGLNWLLENSDKKEIGDFAVWKLEKLHERLLTKHNETFWIKAKTKFENGREYFLYTQVEHTRKPIVSQFDLLLEQGVITLDHLIKRNSKGQVKEKGPIFKIKPDSLDLLFPPSKKHSLI